MLSEARELHRAKRLMPGRSRRFVSSSSLALDRLCDTKADVASYASLLRECTSLSLGKRIHSHLREIGYDQLTFLGNLLVQMYRRFGSLEDAQVAFDNIPEKNVFSWNIMLGAYALKGQLQEARSLFDEMPHKDAVSSNSMITAYAQNGHAHEARALFDVMVQRDVVSWTAMVTAYAQTGNLLKARHMFVKMPQHNVVSWNAMTAAYALNGHLQEARELFATMLERNTVSWNAMIQAYVQNGHQEEAKSIFDIMPHQTMASCTSIISAYAENGYLEEARSMFDKMPQWDVVLWSAMIAAYARVGHGKEALVLSRKMDQEGVHPDKITFISLLDACANLAAVAEGKVIHANVVDSGFQADVTVATAIVNMYSKCGNLEDALSVFEEMPERDVVSWTAMISGYAQNGQPERVLELFQVMILEGVEPVYITFIRILVACNHGGLDKDGRQCFVAMQVDYGIVPSFEHYLCMIDLLARAGQLEKAEDLINSMPFQPDAAAWKTLLAACTTHKDIERGSLAAKRVFTVEPEKASPHVLLSNIYAVADNQDDAVAKIEAALSR